MGAARTAIKVTAAALDTVRRPGAGLVVLIYHRVGRRTPVEVDLPTSLFAEQMAVLAAGADVALPVLVEHRVPVTLYVASAFLEEQRPFPDDGRPLSWRALRDATATGLVDVGSHTHEHALLDRLPPAAVDDELDRSITTIADRVGITPVHFAYPKAVMGSPAADAAVRARFVSAAVAGTRVNRYARTDPFRLARSPIQVSDGMRWFRHKLTGGMAFEDDVRRVVNRRRYAGATT